jgi:hypothetical protein
MAGMVDKEYVKNNDALSAVRILYETQKVQEAEADWTVPRPLAWNGSNLEKVDIKAI